MALQGKNGGALGYVGTGLERAIEEYLQQISDVPEKIRPLITKLNRITAVLKDAEQKTISSHEVRCWLQKSKQILLDAEDLFDELATDAAVQKMRAHTQSSIGLIQIIVRCLHLFPAIPTAARAMRRRMQGVNDRLDLLASETPMLAHQISAAPVSCTRLTCRDTSSLLPDESSVIGRDGEKEQIIEILLSDPVAESSSNNNKGFSIVPIVGLGGVGKTTLAQLVYNHEKVRNHFELRMWVCVSNDFDLRRLTEDIIEAALVSKGMNEQCQVNNWDSMQQRLLQEVEGKTFLLVLDDVWEAEHSKWEALFKPLCSGKKESKVLVTSRNRAFVNKLSGPMEDPIPLEGLSNTVIWDVCKKYAFKGTTSAEYSHLQVLGSSIVQKLKGSPLAARTIGSLLNRELSEQHWKTVLESEFWKLEQGEEDILPALLLSYQYLPPDLKQCFAYCSLFPKDYRFSRKEVVQLWEAQSFIRKDRGTRMETMGSKYFDQLLCMSFFEPPPGQSDGNDYYVMHDLIHDLAEYVSRDDCLRVEDQKLEEIPNTVVCHVSVWVGRRDQIDTINKLCFSEKLRTLIFQRSYYLGYHDLDQLFLKLKMLRVLGLRYSWIRELPGSIGDLKHLRYIDLEGDGGLKRLPESLGNLYNLQVLDLYGCQSLGVLPSTMSQLVNLKHLRLYRPGMLSRIDGVGKLTGLQELQVRGRQLRELGGMCMLRELKITHLEEVGSKEEAIQARLHTMECLQALHLYWSKEDNSGNESEDSRRPELEEEVLQALRPNKGIRELHIQSYGGIKSPDWMEVPTLLSSFSSLRHVSLFNCSNWQVPPCSFLGQLCHLEYLEIKSMPEWEEHWSCPVSWDCLRELEIRGCPKLKELPLLPPTLRKLKLVEVGISCLHSELDGCGRVDGGIETASSPHFPAPTSAAVSRLYISSCDNLTSISGLLLPDLVKIEISDCENLVSLPEKGFGHLVSLQSLKIDNCPQLICPLPMQKEEDASTQHLPCSLHALEIEGCGDAMGGWWWVGLQRLTSITRLSLRGCPTTIELLFDSLERNSHPHLLATIRELLIYGYNRFHHGQRSATSSACSSQLPPPPTLPPIPHNNVDASARILTSLKRLTIRNCPNFLQKWGGCVSPSSLERLTVDGDDDLSHDDLSAWWHNLISLKQLTLENLSALPDLSGLASLENLNISSCPSINKLDLMSLPTSLNSLHSLPDLSGLVSLETLLICFCPSIYTLDVMSPPTSLKSLDLQYLENLHSLPDLSGLTSLETLKMYGCPSINPLEMMSLPTSLKRLALGDLMYLHSPPDLGSVASLETLEIFNCLSINTLEVMSLPTSLKSLNLWNLKNLHSLPDMGGLASLETLKIINCPSILSWPASGLPSSLNKLEITECPALTGRHKGKPKSMWPEVAHIPHVEIDWSTLH